MVQAQRFDGISAIVALAEAKKLYPDFRFDSFHEDGAHDNYATYELLHNWNMKAFISLTETNKENFKYPSHINVDTNGVSCLYGWPCNDWICVNNLDTKSLTFYDLTLAASCAACGVI